MSAIPIGSPLGRPPFSSGLVPRLSLQTGATARGRIETTKVEIERGVVKVDRRLQTGEPHVWAIDPGFRINLHTEGPKERTRSRA